MWNVFRGSRSWLGSSRRDRPPSPRRAIHPARGRNQSSVATPRLRARLRGQLGAGRQDPRPCPLAFARPTGYGCHGPSSIALHLPASSTSMRLRPHPRPPRLANRPSTPRGGDGSVRSSSGSRDRRSSPRSTTRWSRRGLAPASDRTSRLPVSLVGNPRSSERLRPGRRPSPIPRLQTATRRTAPEAAVGLRTRCVVGGSRGLGSTGTKIVAEPARR